VQFHLKNRGLQHPRSAASDYIFSSKVKCGLCGNLIVGNKTKAKGREYKSYRCSGRKLKLCNLNISSLELENLFLQHLSSLEWSEAKSEANTTMDEPKNETDELEQELKTIVKRRKKWQFAFAQDAISDQEFLERMKEETDKEKVIQQKLQQTVVQTKSHSKEDIQELLVNIKENWNVLSDYEKKSVVNIIIDSFIITREGIRGQYKFTISDISFN
jgi:site-specific DNA recombinase